MTALDRILLADSLRIALTGGCGHCDTEPDELCAACGTCRCARHDACTTPPEECPECGTTVFEFDHAAADGSRPFPAWMCTGCRWGTAAE